MADRTFGQARHRGVPPGAVPAAAYMKKQKQKLTVENPFSGPLPEPKSLVSIAAQPRFKKLDPPQAVRAALELWMVVLSELKRQAMPAFHEIVNAAAQTRFERFSLNEAVKAALFLHSQAADLVAEEYKLRGSFSDYYQTPIENTDQPQAWPASFKDFLKLVAGGKDKNEQRERFIRYLVFSLHAGDLRKKARELAAEKLRKNGGEPTEEEIRALGADLEALIPDNSVPTVGKTDERVIFALKGYEEKLLHKNVWDNLAATFKRWWIAQKSESKLKAGRAGAAKRDKNKAEKNDRIIA